MKNIGLLTGVPWEEGLEDVEASVVAGEFSFWLFLVLVVLWKSSMFFNTDLINYLVSIGFELQS